jgi:hypothetical protein
VKDDLVKSASVNDAFPASPQQTTLFLEVTALSEVESRLQGELVIKPTRKTF